MPWRFGDELALICQILRDDWTLFVSPTPMQALLKQLEESTKLPLPSAASSRADPFYRVRNLDNVSEIIGNYIFYRRKKNWVTSKK